MDHGLHLRTQFEAWTTPAVSLWPRNSRHARKDTTLDVAAFLREHDPGNLSSKIEADWERNATKICEDVHREQQEWDEWLNKDAASNPGLSGALNLSTDDCTPAELGLCSAWEVDELFAALGNVGRLASSEQA